MLSRSNKVSKLLGSREYRESYLRAKLNELIPSQIRALRLQEDWTQKKLGEEADMKQARISAIEKPGQVKFTLDTLIGLAAAFRVGLQVRFVPFSQMVKWENEFSQDEFQIDPLEKDHDFLEPKKIALNKAYSTLAASDFISSFAPLQDVVLPKLFTAPKTVFVQPQNPNQYSPVTAGPLNKQLNEQRIAS
jgi:transcriptional regulator with XRE-family HTH domain